MEFSGTRDILMQLRFVEVHLKINLNLTSRDKNQTTRINAFNKATVAASKATVAAID